jgi:hypothetical protein
MRGAPPGSAFETTVAERGSTWYTNATTLAKFPTGSGFNRGQP